MDKTQLLDYYSTHYLSRQEILFKLPFNIQADSFWQELVNRRKMRAVILPLYNAQGKPYWYCMTDKMVKASEILCEEAMKQEEFDPYRMEMTTAMTWEMFFTSFVEGTEMDMEEALDYLSQDAEPSNVQEQVLWNNRQALYTMVSGVFRPIDEAFLSQLAYLLTQDLDGTAEGYRQTDIHPIAAMAGESYTVLAAQDIPARMNDFYSFLARTDTHPLIKSAAAQAFLLAARPFPDGNERLSRMVSELILYRSGYDYFRDITISRKIARESYRYYKNMRELLRQENDADMTCFVEYYIDLLARALNEAKEAAAQRETAGAEETIAQERQLATVPFTVPQPTPEEPPIHSGEQPGNPTAEIGDLLAGAKPIVIPTENPADAEAPPQAEKDQSSEIPASREFRDIVENFCRSTRDGALRMGHTIKKMLAQGLNQFTVKDWGNYAAVEQTLAKQDCYYLRKKRIIENVGSAHMAVYRFCLDGLPVSQAEPPEEEPVLSSPDCSVELDEEYINRLHEVQSSQNAREVRYANALIRLISEGKYTFTNSDWTRATGLAATTSDKDLRDIIGLGLVYRKADGRHYVYHIGKSPYGDSGIRLSKSQRVILEQLGRMGKESFTVSEAAKILGVRRDMLDYHLRGLKNTGDVIAVPGTEPPVYRIRDCSHKGNAAEAESAPVVMTPGGTKASASGNHEGADSMQAEPSTGKQLPLTSDGGEQPTEVNEEYINRLHEMQGSENAREARFAKTLLQLLHEGRYSFSSGDWARVSGVARATSDNDLWDAIVMGLVYRTGDTARYVYHIGQSLSGDNSVQLSETQIEILDQLHGKIDGVFTAAQATRVLGMKQSTFNYHLKHILSQGDIVAVPGSYPPAYRLKNSCQKNNMTPSASNITVMVSDFPRVAASAKKSVAWG